MAKEFRAWVQDIKAPEEFFYATLARIDQKSAENPGRFSVVQGIFFSFEFSRQNSSLYCPIQLIFFSDFEKDTTNGFCPRYSNWNETNCKGSDGFN